MEIAPTSFSALKRSRGSVEKLTQAIQSAMQNKKEDERFWEPVVDKAGNGHAIIRFLPTPSQDGEDGLPWIRMFTHGFQGPGGWLIEPCPTTLEQKCPVCERNSILWNSGIESNKAVARDRKRKLSYITNIMVVSDPAKPENDGKVKLYRFGKKIFDKIYEKMHPEFPDEVAFSPFDLWEGANFKLKIRKVEGYRNYDKSEFAPQTPISPDESTLEKLWKQEFSLRELVAQKHFKTYEQIETRLLKVLGSSMTHETAESAQTVPSNALDDQDIGVKVSSPTTLSVVTQAPQNEEDEELSYFKSLAEEE